MKAGPKVNPNPKASKGSNELSQSKAAKYQRSHRKLKRASTVDTDRLIDTTLKTLQDKLASAEFRASDLPKILQSMEKLLERKDLRKIDVTPSEELRAFLSSIDLPIPA